MNNIEEWAQQFNNTGNDSTFFIIGLGNGEYISALLNVICQSAKVFIYEPDNGYYESVMNTELVNKVLCDSRVSFYTAGMENSSLHDIAQKGITCYNYQSILAGVLPGYEQYQDLYVELRKHIAYYTELIIFQQNTDIFLAKKSAVNELENYRDIIKEHSVNQLIAAIKEYKESDVPAIIVSAGPSLDKNIQELKRAKNHAFIIAVDTAMKAILRADIVPDIMICIDPRKESVFFEHKEIAEIPAVFAMDIPSSLIMGHTGSKFYTGNGTDNLMDRIARTYTGESYEILEAGGSVANSAFSLAIAAGFTTIILVGQDLAFTDGKGHTKDAYDDDKKNRQDTENRDDICTVKDIYGNLIKTETRMRSYIKWFEGAISKNHNIKVIDATEGGAYIEGTEITTLKEAINKECTEERISFPKIIGSINPLYNDMQQKEAKQYLAGMSEQLQLLGKEMENGRDAYIQLKRIIDTHSKDNTDKVMEEITKVNNLSETHPLMDIIIKFAINDEYNARDSIGNNNAEDVNAVIESGINLINGYITGINELISIVSGLFQ